MPWLVLYLVVSALTYVGLLRAWFRIEPEWPGVFWALFGFVPIGGQMVLFFVWVTDRDHKPISVPRWLQRLGGVEPE